MKKILLMLPVLAALNSQVNAQAHSEKFAKAMSLNLTKLQEAQSAVDKTTYINAIERIGASEPKEWLPYYYCALHYVGAAFETKDPKEIEALATKAESFLNKIDATQQENSEVLTVKAMVYGAQLMVDPMTRGMKYGALSAQALAAAKKADPNNPRPYLYEAQSKFYTPEAWGGGKKVAKPIVEEAMKKFEAWKSTDELAPNWGIFQAQSLLRKCGE